MRTNSISHPIPSQHLPLSVGGWVSEWMIDSFRLEIAIASPSFASLLMLQHQEYQKNLPLFPDGCPVFRVYTSKILTVILPHILARTGKKQKRTWHFLVRYALRVANEVLFCSWSVLEHGSLGYRDINKMNVNIFIILKQLRINACSMFFQINKSMCWGF